MFALMAAVIILLFGCQLALNSWGRSVVPDDARFPFALGVPPSIESSMSKRTALWVYLLTGTWFSALSLFAASQRASTGWIGAALMVFFLAIEYHQIRRLSR